MSSTPGPASGGLSSPRKSPQGAPPGSSTAPPSLPPKPRTAGQKSRALGRAVLTPVVDARAAARLARTAALRAFHCPPKKVADARAVEREKKESVKAARLAELRREVAAHFDLPQPPENEGKGQQPLGAGPIYTLETEPSSEAGQSPLDNLKENRLRCLETANLLQQMADFDFSDTLHKAADKIQNCSLAGAFRSVASGVANKIGQALCRCRLCPNCQRVLANKRRSTFMEWLEMNQRPLAGFKFYHMVLTVRHSVALGLRAGLYTGELLDLFAALRGSGKTCNRARREWWDKRVSGGVFSVELAPGKSDTSAHIHLHITLFCALGSIPIFRKDRNSEFVKDASSIWRKLTNDKKARAVFLEPVYFLDEARVKQQYKPGQPVENLYKAVAECMKYTLKSDASDLSRYTPDFLRELLTTPNRYFGRFGVLASKTVSPIIFCELDRLNTNFQDLEQVAEKELKSLYNPKTGGFVHKEETRIALSYFKNTKIKYSPVSDSSRLNPDKMGNEPYYSFRNSSRVAYLPPDAQNAALRYLARTIKDSYDPDNDLVVLRI